MSRNNVVVVGGGLAGLAAAMKLAELGLHTDLASLAPVKRYRRRFGSTLHKRTAFAGVTCVELSA